MVGGGGGEEDGGGRAALLPPVLPCHGHAVATHGVSSFGTQKLESSEDGEVGTGEGDGVVLQAEGLTLADAHIPRTLQPGHNESVLVVHQVHCLIGQAESVG